ncbi:hypothetical protein [Streptosporangium sp. NPDC087985]|uniref:hypothetical protein n=1 Tax=Streptosporangium sp. NPDC087985 TaxID=3366196 RepID=UPI00382C9F61
MDLPKSLWWICRADHVHAWCTSDPAPFEASALPSFHLPDQEMKIGKDARLESGEQDLDNGVDVCWGFYLRGDRYAHTAMVCCPNRHAPGYPCPER